MGSVRIFTVATMLAVGILPAGVANAHTGDVQIARGGQPASIIQTREANVRVFRGTPVTAPTGTERQVASAVPADVALLSGSRIWFVDPAAGTLRVCRLVSTTQVGEHRIECQASALPR